MSAAASDPADLLARLDRWLGELRDRGLAPEPAAGHLEQALARSRGERLDAPDDPLLVAMLCGPTAVGKSSLINAVAGAPISDPGLGATTAHAVVYVHERDDPRRLFEYGEALGQLGRAGASLVRHARDELLHKVIVDTPDIDSALRRHAATTEALVHCADLVLFVTSPEKYKTLHSARWIAGHRRQRAIAFVLNKWDREGIGLQYERRDLVDRDFHRLLADEGFADPLVFKVSTLAGGTADLRALQDWLADGLDRSLAAAIGVRRRRSAWGRLAAAAAPLVPARLADHPLIGIAMARLAETAAEARQLVEPEVAAALPRGLGRGTRPSTPGLLGSWMTLADGVAAAGPVRMVASLRGSIESALAAPGRAAPFGQAAADLLARTTTALAAEAEARRVPLGPVGTAWAAEAERLGRRLATLPVAVEGELATASGRPSLRRGLGVAVFWGFEILIGLVLLVGLWRVGTGFVYGQYAEGNVVLDAAALVLVLLFGGQVAAKLLFPALGERLRAALAQRARGLVDEAWRQAQATLDGQVEAAARLAADGRHLLGRIDAVVRSLGDATGDDGAGRLFADAVPMPMLPEPVPVVRAVEEPLRPAPARRPRFD